MAGSTATPGSGASSGERVPPISAYYVRVRHYDSDETGSYAIQVIGPAA